MAVTTFTAIAALGSSILGAVGVTGALATGVTFLTVSVGFLAQTAIGLALNALTPKPKLRGANRGYQVTARGSALDHQIIYGRMRTGGVIVYDKTTGTNNVYLHRLIAFAGHEIESFDEIYVNDELLTLDTNGEVTAPDKYVGKIRVNEHLGAADQAADSDLVSATANEDSPWTNEHRLRGIAYLYVRLSFDQNAFSNGVPEITATISGKKVYDPRTATTVWSDNPALCLRDYLSEGYGLAEESTNIDDTLVSAAANVCDETDTISGEKRYTCNGAFVTQVTPFDILNDMLTSMGGLLWYAQGEWRMKPAYYVAPTVSFNEDDLRSSITVKTRHSRRNNFNVVKGTFRGEESNWQVTDYPEVTNAAFLTADNNQESVIDLELPFTDTADEARRIARIVLERNRQQLSVSASFGLRAFQVQTGDIIQLSVDRFGWTNKEFEVTGWTFGLVEGQDLQVQMTLREISESVFDEVDDGVVYEKDNTTLLSPFSVPGVGISVEADALVTNEKVSNIAIATITSGRSEAIDYVEVEYRFNRNLFEDPEPDPLPAFSSFGQGPLGEFIVRDLKTGIYDFRVRAINSFGVKGDYEFLNDIEINAFIGDPSDVTDFDKELSGGTLFLSWEPSPDADLSHYRIKHNSNTTGATWGNSTTVIKRVPRPGNTATLPARSGTFLIRAYDKEGNFSENATSLVVLPSELPQLNTTVSQVEDPTFSSTNTTNTTVVSNSLEIDDTSAANPSGEYLFSAYIDTGSARNARVTGFRTFTRKFDDGTLLWDDIPQRWDTWPDNWDTWTDEEANFGDVSVNVYVSATDDDPAVSPTWGDYTLANGNFVQGRAFRFKAILNSDNTNYTPNITELSATVEY
jgi:hypothetical protein